MRLFVAVQPPDDVLDRVAGLRRPERRGSAGRPGPSGTSRSRFLGEVADPGPVAAALDAAPLAPTTARARSRRRPARPSGGRACRWPGSTTSPPRSAEALPAGTAGPPRVPRPPDPGPRVRGPAGRPGGRAGGGPVPGGRRAPGAQPPRRPWGTPLRGPPHPAADRGICRGSLNEQAFETTVVSFPNTGSRIARSPKVSHPVFIFCCVGGAPPLPRSLTGPAPVGPAATAHPHHRRKDPTGGSTRRPSRWLSARSRSSSARARS